jgi:hypothetical protein
MEQALDYEIAWCMSLISLKFPLPNLSAICHKPSPLGLGVITQASCPQSYPQNLGLSASKSNSVAYWLNNAQGFGERGGVGDNCAAFHLRGDSICFQSYKPQAGRSGP